MYSIEDLYDENKNTTNFRAVDYFVGSEYPNDYFLQQFCAPYSPPFCHKKYWEGFACIIVRRGLPKINDVKQKILIWLQDINWSGCGIIIDYVRANKQEFKNEII